MPYIAPVTASSFLKYSGVKMSPSLAISATITTDEIEEKAVETGLVVAHSHSNDPLTCNAAIASIEIILEEGLVDVAVLPIGDRFTMGPADAVRAIDFIEPKVVIPCHYDTWPPIEQDAAAFAAAVGDRAQVQVMTPNALFEF